MEKSVQIRKVQYLGKTTGESFTTLKIGVINEQPRLPIDKKKMNGSGNVDCKLETINIFLKI